jgi:hypothetical protein
VRYVVRVQLVPNPRRGDMRAERLAVQFDPRPPRGPPYAGRQLAERVRLAAKAHPEDARPRRRRERPGAFNGQLKRRGRRGKLTDPLLEPMPLSGPELAEESERHVPPLRRDPGQARIRRAQFRPALGERLEDMSRRYDGDERPQRQPVGGVVGLAGVVAGGVVGVPAAGGVVVPAGGVVPGGVPGGTAGGGAAQMK